jgi:hypothetical protein
MARSPARSPQTGHSHSHRLPILPSAVPLPKKRSSARTSRALYPSLCLISTHPPSPDRLWAIIHIPAHTTPALASRSPSAHPTWWSDTHIASFPSLLLHPKRSSREKPRSQSQQLFVSKTRKDARNEKRYRFRHKYLRTRDRLIPVSPIRSLA